MLANLNFGLSQRAKQVHSSYARIYFPVLDFKATIAVKLNGMFLTFVNSQTPVWIDGLTDSQSMLWQMISHNFVWTKSVPEMCYFFITCFCQLLKIVEW